MGVAAGRVGAAAFAISDLAVDPLCFHILPLEIHVGPTVTDCIRLHCCNDFMTIIL